MTTNLQNLFKGGPQIKEKLESNETTNEPLKDLEGKPINLDGGGLYKPFNPEEKAEKKLNLAKENKKYENILSNLQSQGLISNKTIEELNTQNLEKLDIDKLETIETKEKKVLEEVFGNLKNPEKNKEKNLNNLAKDIKEIQTIVGKENFDFKLNKNNKNFSEEVLNKIGGNYLSIPNTKNEIEYEKNFSLAIDTTKIQIENEIQNINKDSETYKQAIKNINSDNIATKLEGIQSLYVLAYSGEGKFAKNKQNMYKEHRITQLEQEKQKIEKEMQELQQQSEEANNKKMQELQQQLDSIKKEKKEIISGEVFESGKLDLASEEKEKSKKSSN